MADGSAEREIVVSRLVDAPRELVFAAFTEREHVENWWIPAGSRTHEWSMQPGGLWRYSQPGGEGEEYPFKITFVEIERPARLVYDFESEGEYASDAVRTHVSFEEADGKTQVTLRLVFVSAEAREESAAYGAVQGAESALAEMAGYVEGLA